MPTVEWAGTPTVSRPSQASRETPERDADLFAAMFDSARQSVSSRAGQVIRQGRQGPAKPGRAEQAADRQMRSPVEVGQKRLGRRRSTEMQPEPRPSRSAEESAKRIEARNKADKTPEMVEEADPIEPDEPVEKTDPTEPAEPVEKTNSIEPGKPEEQINPEDSREPASTPSPDGGTVGDGSEEGTEADAGSEKHLHTQPVVKIQPIVVKMPAVDPAALPGTSQPTRESAAVQTIIEPCTAASSICAPCEPSSGSDSVSTEATVDSGEGAGSPGAAKAVAELSLTGWQLIRNIAVDLAQLVQVAGGLQDKEAVLSAGGPPVVLGSNPDSSTCTTVATTISLSLPTAVASDETSDKPSSRDHSAQKGVSPETAGETRTSDRPAAGTADFQSLIDAADRVRREVQSSGPRASTSVAGRELNGKGIALTEARAVDDLARVVRSAIGNRHSSMVLQLDPPELGRLRIDVRMHDQTLSLRLQADTVAGHDALQSRLDDLRNALEQHGLRLNQFDVQLRSPAAPSAESRGGQNDQQAPPQWDGSPSHEPGGHDPAGGGEAFAESRYSSESELPFADGGLAGESGSNGNERLAETGVDLVV